MLARSMARIVLAAAATGGAAWLLARAVSSGGQVGSLAQQLTQVGVGVGGGLVTFVVAALLLRIEEFDLVKRLLFGRLRR
jgi:hypothetical protein